MKPQLPSPFGRILVPIFGLLASLAFSSHAVAAPPACTASNMPTGRTLFAVDNPNNQVVVLDASTNQVAVACAIGVGHGPTNLAVSPDSTLLFVENDTDASLTVVTLADPSLPGNVTTMTATTLGITAPMAANLAVSPDGTLLYLVSIGTGDTQAQFSVISLPTLKVAPKTPIVTSPAVPVSRRGPIGLTFTPTTIAAPIGTAYVTTESASYAINVATQAITMLTDSANANANVLAGTVAVDPAGNFAYAINASSTSSNATVYRIAASNNSTNGLPGVTPICTFAGSNSITAPNTPTAPRAYYTCAGSNFIQTVDAASNSQAAVGHVGVGSGSAHPLGISIPYDGVTAYVGLDDGTLVAVDIASSTASPAVPVGTSLRSVVARPPVVSGLSPQTPSVGAGRTASFSATVSFANSSALIWTVNGIVGGNATVGTIDSAGRYTAPKAIPSGGTVTVAVTSPEAPPVSPIPLLSTTVTIDPVLVFTSTTQTLTAGTCSAIMTVQSQDSSGNPFPVTNPEPLVLTSNSSGGGFFSDNACSTGITTVTIAPTASTATFFYKDTKAGSPTLTVTGSATFTPTTVTQTETVNAAAASTLAFTVQPATVVAGTAIAPAVQVSVEDTNGNVVTTDTSNVSIAISTGGVLSGTSTTTVAAAAGVVTFSNLVPTKTGTFTLLASDGTLTGATSGSFNVTPGTASKLVFTTTVQGQTATSQPVTSGALGGNVTPLPSVFVAVQDANGNVVTTGTGSTASITISSTPANVGGTITVAAVNGVATFSNLQFTIAGTYTLTAASTGVTSAVSNSFTLTSNITVSVTSTFNNTTNPVKIEDLPAGTDTFTATPNAATPSGDPNSPSLGVTWIMVSCSGSPVDTNNATSCGQVAPNGAYTPPSRVPLIPANTFTVQATAVADPSKTATSGSIAIKSSILLTMPSISALIGAPVDFTPRTMNGNVNLGTGANQSDLNLGVTLAITGTCVAPPNYTFSGNDGNGCGSFNGSQTASPPTYTYTAPAVVPMAASCAANPASCLGTQNKAMITVTAMSVADPNQPSASTTFVISSNISFAIAVGTDPQTLKDICNPLVYPSTDATLIADLTIDPCGFKGWPANGNLSPPAPTLTVGFPAIFAKASAQNFGTVTGLTWVPSAGTVQPGSGIQTTFTAPTTVPTTNNGTATITAYAIADFTIVKPPFPIPVVAGKLIPDSIATQFLLTVPSPGSIVLDFQGPGQPTLSCPPSGVISLSSPMCTFTSSTNAGTTIVTLTLKVAGTGGTYLRPPGAPLAPSPGQPGTILATMVLILLIFALATRRGTRLLWLHASPSKGAIATLFLCTVVLTWAVACGQFSPQTPPPPPIRGNGAVTVQATPSTGPTSSLFVPVSVQ